MRPPVRIYSPPLLISLSFIHFLLQRLVQLCRDTLSRTAPPALAYDLLNYNQASLTGRFVYFSNFHLGCDKTLCDVMIDRERYFR